MFPHPVQPSHSHLLLTLLLSVFVLLLLTTTTTATTLHSPHLLTPDPRHLAPRINTDLNPAPAAAAVLPVAAKRAPGAIPADQAAGQQGKQEQKGVLRRKVRARAAAVPAAVPADENGGDDGGDDVDGRIEDIGKRVAVVGSGQWGSRGSGRGEWVVSRRRGENGMKEKGRRR